MKPLSWFEFGFKTSSKSKFKSSGLLSKIASILELFSSNNKAFSEGIMGGLAWLFSLAEEILKGEERLELIKSRVPELFWALKLVIQT